jgi:DNA-binding transcriptional ArsR family regulator
MHTIDNRAAQVTIRRGSLRSPRDFDDALDTLGIQRGEDFVVLAARDVVDTTANPDGAARRDDIDTAKAAAKLPREGQAGRVLCAIGRVGPSTRAELARVLGLPRDSVSPRVGALKRLGLVEQAGKRGRQSVVRLTPAGAEKVREWGGLQLAFR